MLGMERGKMVFSFFDRQYSMGEGGVRTKSSIYAPTAPFGRAAAVEWFDVHFLPRGKKRTKKARGGFAPRPPCVRVAYDATLKGSVWQKLLHLVDGCLQDGFGEGAMPCLGKHVADIAKKGTCGLKALWKMVRGYLSPWGTTTWLACRSTTPRLPLGAGAPKDAQKLLR